MIWIHIIILAFLILLSIIDILKKGKGIPSFLTTFALLFVAVINIKNIPFGILAGLLGWFFLDFFEDDSSNVFSGITDLKMTILLGLMVSNLVGFLVLCLIISAMGVLYKIVIIRIFPKMIETPFIPVFLLTYIIMIVLEVFFNVPIF